MAGITFSTYNDVHTLASAFAVAIQAGLLSREQAQAAFKDQLYGCGLLERPIAPKKVEEKKK